MDTGPRAVQSTVESPVVLNSQDVSVHDTPCLPEDYDRVLAALVPAALAGLRPDGNLELDPDDEDVGDTSLGVTSLLALAWTRGIRPAGLAAAARRSLDFFLRQRVFRTDNPGYPNLRVRGSGVPYARYVLADGRHPFGDWPSTVWALLQAVNVLELGRLSGPFTTEQLGELRAVAQGYWTWLTEITYFNPQDTANQALGAVVGGLALALDLERHGGRVAAGRVRAEASGRYRQIRAQRLPERGFLLPGEHGGAWDGNYGPVSLSFLAQAHVLTADPMFLADGCELARYLDMRMSVRGFDSGGSRYIEQHVGFEGTLGLRYFGQHIRADIGRYLGNARQRYLLDGEGHGDGTVAPHGHFAFMTVWAMQDGTPWYRDGGSTNDRYRLRHGDVSVSFDAALTPHLVHVAGVAVLASVLERQRGIGPLYREADAGTGGSTGVRAHLLTRPLAPARTREAQAVAAPAGAVQAGAWHAKLVVKAVATWSQVLLTTQLLYLTDGVVLHVVAVLDPAALPVGARPSLLAGLPYAEPAAGGYCKILGVRAGDGQELSFGYPGGELTTTGPVYAGGLALRGNGPLRVGNPAVPEGFGRYVFSGEATLRQTQEQAAFALAPDPHGYGNPEQAWQHLHHTNLVEVLDGVPAGRLLALAVSYAPAGAPVPPPGIAAVPDGVEVTVPGLSALIGDVAGDEHGDPVLRLA